MKKIEILKNYQDGNRIRLKGQELEVLEWKADELIKLGVAKLKYKEVETNMSKMDFEKR